MHLLDNPVRPYPWGSPTAIPELLGVEPSGEPQAELWIGAHRGSPSRLSGTGQSLLDLIEADPEGELGSVGIAEFGPRLPFLMKVLAAKDPLSLQAHPDPEQAREGYAREDAAGIPLNAPERNYKDPDAKPELICALSELEALVGFRPVERTLAVATELAVPAIEPVLDQLREQPDADGLRTAFTMVMTAPRDNQQAMVADLLAACVDHPSETAHLLTRLGQKFPGDPGIVAALLLDHVHLEPGQAVYLPAGNLHAYIEGVGVEIMASSDNVLRGGLTSKHIDLPELLHILDFAPRPTRILTTGPEGAFTTPARDFRLARIELSGGHEHVLEPAGPQILLCVDGNVVAGSEGGKVGLTRGQSAYAGAGEGDVTLTGDGTVFRATAGLD